MTWLPSIRARFIAGSLLWGGGLVLLVHVISVLMVIGYPAFRGVVHIVGMFAAAALFMGGGLGLARSGLASFVELRRRLASVHDGYERQVGGSYPSEIQPLVDDLNLLIEHRDGRVRTALAKAGDLAHGLKTPLAVIGQEADLADAAGHGELAATLRAQVERMRRHVDYHLAHARAAASGATLGARTLVAPSAEALARTLQRLHADRQLAIIVRVDGTHAFRGQREDLDEMLGNLLDNACKWARSRVEVHSTVADENLVTINVDDDGAGVPAAMRDVVLQRGVRADEAAPGFGFGLAIVRELAELYGGSITLAEAPLGGLRAELRLPLTWNN